jgi:hypothetical protein
MQFNSPIKINPYAAVLPASAAKINIKSLQFTIGILGVSANIMKYSLASNRIGYH